MGLQVCHDQQLTIIEMSAFLMVMKDSDDIDGDICSPYDHAIYRRSRLTYMLLNKLTLHELD